MAYEIFKSKIPIVSAVGHETDFTIADFVADLRAPTPSAAAELAVPSGDELLKRITLYEERLRKSLEKAVEKRKLQLEIYSRKQVLQNPLIKINERQMLLDSTFRIFENALMSSLEEKKTALSVCASRLEGLSPLGVLGRGFSVTKKADGTVVRSVDNVKSGDDISVTVSDGKLNAVVK